MPELFRFAAGRWKIFARIVVIVAGLVAVMRVVDYRLSDHSMGTHRVAHRWVMMHMDMYIFVHNMRMAAMYGVVVRVGMNMMASMLSPTFSRRWLRFRSWRWSRSGCRLRGRGRFGLSSRLPLLLWLLRFLVLITPVLLLPVIIVVFVALLP